MGILEELAAEIGVSASALYHTLQQGTAAEQLDPSYLTIDPTTGAVSALFTGGLQLTEDTSGSLYTASHSVGWQDASGIREYIKGFINVGAHSLILNAEPDANDHALMVLEARAAGGAGTADVSFELRDSTGATKVVPLYDSAGNSLFLQLAAGPQQRALALGTGTVTWGGGTAIALQTINHGIGRTPTAVIVCPWGNPSDGAGAMDFGSVDHTVYSTTQFNAAVTRSGAAPAAGTTCSFDWVAVG